MTDAVKLIIMIGAVFFGLVALAYLEPRYEMIQATNDAVWRLDTRTGEVSLCGVTTDGLRRGCLFIGTVALDKNDAQ